MQPCVIISSHKSIATIACGGGFVLQDRWKPRSETQSMHSSSALLGASFFVLLLFYIIVFFGGVPLSHKMNMDQEGKYCATKC